MTGIDKLISQLGSFWKGKREKARQELVREGVRNPREVVPALMGAMAREKEKIRINARRVYEKIDQKNDLTPILLSELNGHNHSVAINLLDAKGAKGSKYEELTSTVEEKMKVIRSLELDIKDLIEEKNEAEELYRSQSFEESFSRLRELNDELEKLSERAKELSDEINRIDDELSYLESYNIDIEGLQSDLKENKELFKKREFKDILDEIRNLDEKIKRKKKDTEYYRKKVDDIWKKIQKAENAGIHLEEVKNEFLREVSPSTSDAKMEEVAEWVRKEVSEKKLEKKVQELDKELGRRLDLLWQNSEAEEKINCVSIAPIGGQNVVVAGSSDNNVYLFNKKGEPIWVGDEPDESVRSVKVGGLGETEVVAAGTYGNKVYVWDREGNFLWEGTDPEKSIRSVTMGKLDDQYVVIAGTSYPGVYVWDKEGNLLWDKTLSADGLDYTAGGKVRMGKLGGLKVIVAAFKKVHVWNKNEGLIWKGSIPFGNIYDVAFGRLNNQRVIVGGSDNSNVYVWNPEGKLVWRADEPNGTVQSVAVGNLNGQEVVVAGAQDNSIYVWNAWGSLLWWDRKSTSINKVVLSEFNEDNMICAMSNGQQIYMWAGNGESLGKISKAPGWIKDLDYGRLGMSNVLVSGDNKKNVNVWKFFSVRGIHSKLKELQELVPSEGLMEDFEKMLKPIDLDNIHITEALTVKLKDLERRIKDRRLSTLELQKNIESVKRDIDYLSEAGIVIEEFRSELEEIKDKFDRGDLEFCQGEIKDLEKKIRRSIKTSRPTLEVSFIQQERLEPEVWTVVPIKVMNSGDMDAEDIEIHVGGEVRSHKPIKISRLGTKSSQELELRLLASGKGHVPTEVETEYCGALEGEKYEEVHSPDLIVGEYILDMQRSEEEERKIEDLESEDEIREKMEELRNQEGMIDLRDVEKSLEDEEIEKAGELLRDLIRDFREYNKVLAELRALDERKSQLAEKLADGEIDRKTFNDAIEGIKDKKHDLESSLNEMRDEVIHEDYEKPF